MAEFQGQPLSLFQIENLVLTRSPFLMLIVGPITLTKELEPLFTQAREIEREKLRTYLSDQKISLEQPLVLICKEGRASRAAAAQLEKAGFRNVYYAEGGVEGLMSELEL